MSETITNDILHSYVDGQLPASWIVEVEAYLAENPDAASDVAVWQRQRDAITTLFAPVAAEPVPARLRAARIAAEQTGRLTRGLTWMAAAVVLVCIGLGSGWLLRPLIEPAPRSSDLLIASAVTAHAVYSAEKRHAVEVLGTDRDHLVTWLSNRLATPIIAPDLVAEGLTLVGGRLLPGDLITGRAAQLMYENSASERVTVYITAALPDRATAYQFADVNQTEAYYWANAFITCTVVGSLPEARMKSVSQAVYQQMTAPDQIGSSPLYRG